MNLEEMTLDVVETVEVKGTPQAVFKSVLYRFGEGCTKPDGGSIQLQIEPWAGGRWFRDRGDGIQHLWGHVQAIKPGEVAGAQRANVHVLSGAQSRRGQA